MGTIRRAFIVDETMATEGGFIPCVVFEGESALYPMKGTGRGSRPWVWGPTLQEAKEQAREANHDRGLTDADVSEIIASAWQACPHNNRPENCDGEDCKRRDCELHYMEAPLRLEPEPVSDPLLDIINETIANDTAAANRQRAGWEKEGK